jgi:hypothetical protein
MNGLSTIHPELPGVRGIERVFAVDDGTQAARPLRLGDDVLDQPTDRWRGPWLRTFCNDSGASGHSAPAPTDNGLPSGTAIRGCYSELDAGYLLKRPQRPGSPTLSYL